MQEIRINYKNAKNKIIFLVSRCKNIKYAEYAHIKAK